MAKSRKPASDGSQSGSELNVGRFETLHIWQIQAVRDLLVVAAAFGLVWIGYALRTVTVPLLIALLLAYLFEPLIARLCQHSRMTRTRAVSGLMLTVGALIVLLMTITIPLVLTQTAQLVRDVSSGKYQQNIARAAELLPEETRESLGSFLQFIPGLWGEDEPAGVDSDAADDDEERATGLEDEQAAASDDDDDTGIAIAGDDEPTLTLEQLNLLIDERLALQRQQWEQGERGGEAQTWISLARRTAGTLWSLLIFIISAGLVAFLIPFYFFFFSIWYPDVIRFGRELLPAKNKDRSLELIRKMDHVVAAFVRGRIVISVLMGVMLAIGWAICQVPYPVVAGMIVGIFCAVPYLGGIGIPLAVGLLVVDQLGVPASNRMPWWLMIAGPTLVFAIVQVVESYILTPVIAGKATNLDPVTIVVVVLAGGSVAGVYGMLLAIPVAACGKIVTTELLMPRIRAWLKGEAKDPLPIQRE